MDKIDLTTLITYALCLCCATCRLLPSANPENLVMREKLQLTLQSVPVSALLTYVLSQDELTETS